jgi:dolichol-phosphate mannosyltransferase
VQEHSKILVFVPTYNERENVDKLCSQIMALNLDVDVLFLDDNSPDGTGEVLDRLAERYARVKVIHRTGKLGIGSAHREGIAWAYDHQYSSLITMDCDFTHPPEYLPEFINKSCTADVVVGSRHLLKNSVQEWTVFRRFLTRSGHMLTRHLLKIPYDASSAYRLYCLNNIAREIFDLIPSTGYSFFFESLYVLHANGLSIKEVPIVLPARSCGQSKMGVPEALQGLLRLARLYSTTLINRERYRMTELPPSRLNPIASHRSRSRFGKRCS